MHARALLIASMTLALAGCWNPVPEGPPLGYETDEDTCGNGADDDGDGRIDCRDEDCVVRGFCPTGIPIVPPEEAEGIAPGFDRGRPDFAAERARALRSCTDRIDNDGDGQPDCADSGCRSIAELCCGAEFNDATCSNGLDDDGNGFADCNDFTCRQSPFVTVCDVELDCANRRDDDGDRRIDCDDTDCGASPACTNGERDCANGVDDDGNGAIDCRDNACRPTDACRGEEDGEAFCTDGADNDGDGAIDCDDSACAASPLMRVALYCMARSGPENSVDRCSDGVDNDANGFVDCRDFGCTMASRGATPEAIAYCASLTETTLARCSDGVDNDGNGFVDCADFACTMESRGATREAAMHCATRLENTLERCRDGVDNDGNGFIDCADFACSRSMDAAILEHCTMLAENTIARCTDGIDNDGNGFTDCEDFSCERSADAAVRTACSLVSEASYARCQNGRDDDRDGFTDCNDNSCSNFVAVQYSRFSECETDEECGLFADGSLGHCLHGRVVDQMTGALLYTRNLCASLRSPCREGVSIGDDLRFVVIGPAGEFSPVEIPQEERDRVLLRMCSDGIDNDSDGVADCDDFDCNWAAASRDYCAMLRGGRRLCE